MNHWFTVFDQQVCPSVLSLEIIHLLKMGVCFNFPLCLPLCSTTAARKLQKFCCWVKHWLICIRLSFLCDPSVSMHDKRVSISRCVAGPFCLPEARGQWSQASTTYCEASECEVCQLVVEFPLFMHHHKQTKNVFLFMEKIAWQRIILEVVASGRAAYGNLCEIRDLFMVY